MQGPVSYAACGYFRKKLFCMLPALQPPFLKKGQTIGITLPAGYMPLEKLEVCIGTLQAWGYQVMLGKTVGSSSANYFSGTDEERLNELQAMLDDDAIHAILCGRGGYGTNRIVDRLDWKKFKRNPKWIIGFSDITVLHCHLLSRLGIASLHAPMGAAFNDGEHTNAYITSLKNALAGKKARYTCAAHAFNKKGEASGPLVGGNLSLLVNMIGTRSDVKTNGCILFLEEIGEYIYGVDRMFRHLLRAGRLHNLAGLIIGGITDVKDTDRPFGSTAYEAIYEVAAELGIPIAFNFPVSHNKENVALKVGISYHLKVSARGVALAEV